MSSLSEVFTLPFGPSCRIGPHFESKVTSFRARDRDSSEVLFITDFDHTLTEFTSTQCHSVLIEHTDSVFKREFSSFVSEPWPTEELDYVVTRWQESHKMVLDRGGITVDKLEMSMQSSNIRVRSGVRELFQKLKAGSINTIIASCGFEEVIKRSLEEVGVDVSHSHISVDAHALIFHPEHGRLIDIKPEVPIHHMSKRTLHERHPKITQIEKERHIYAVVVGDSQGDFEIMRGHAKSTIIHIGYATDEIKAQKMLESSWCDVVIIGDDNLGFHHVHEICNKLMVFKE
jgi:2-hydroxy-3-keto-5-methylthiopentenyl-1-phosphate phosphatase